MIAIGGFFIGLGILVAGCAICDGLVAIAKALKEKNHGN